MLFNAVLFIGKEIVFFLFFLSREQNKRVKAIAYVLNFYKMIE